MPGRFRVLADPEPFNYSRLNNRAVAATKAPFVIVATYARWGAEGIDERQQNLSTLDELQKNAIDLYAEVRSLYRQHRASELRHGAPAPTSNEMDDLYRDPAPPVVH